MILISSIQEDYSTNSVIDWLESYNQEVLRINGDDRISNINITGNNLDISFNVNSNSCNLKDVKSYWLRKGQFNINSLLPNKDIEESDIYDPIYSHLINEELKTIEQYILFTLEKKRKLGSYYQGNANKLKSLFLAKEVGLETPDSIVSSSKKPLQEFYNIHKAVISKGVQDIMTFIYESRSYNYMTEVVNENDIEEMSNSFFPSLLQKNVRKLYELRVFYMKGEFSSMAIFSQEDKQTKVDFRVYNLEKPNRTVPYNLPTEIEQKLHLFMQKMELDTGSIDLIVTPELEYVFLEVNPVGQYGMTSMPCNYYLDEKIAKYLAY